MPDSILPPNDQPATSSYWRKLLVASLGPMALTAAIILFLYNVQLGGYSAFEGVINPLWVGCLGCVLIYLFLALALLSPDRAALITMALTIVFFNLALMLTYKKFNHGANVAEIGTNIVYGALFWSLFAVVPRINFTWMRKGTAFVAAFLLAMQVQVVLYRAANFNMVIWPRTNWQVIPPEVAQAGPPKTKAPDIYYIIADTMPSQSVLENYYGLKDRSFDNFLKDQGFYVAEESHSNYPITLMSVPSSLNMTLLNETASKMDAKDYAFDMSRLLMQNPRVGLILKKFGYRFINIGSGWSNTNFLWQADENISSSFWDEMFVPCLYGTLLGWPTDCNYILDHIRRVRLEGFRALAQSSTEPGPKFVLCHMLMPHVPCVFDEDGKPANGILAYNQQLSENKLFLGQTLFCQKKLKQFINQILAQPGPKPIIVVQGDHGSATSGDVYANSKTWPDRFIKERFGILNAYYLPDHENIGLYQNITPINSFRLIFNHYLGTKFALQEDRSFALDPASPFNFRDVTGILNNNASESGVSTLVPVRSPRANPLSEPDLD